MPSSFGLLAPNSIGPGMSWPDSAAFVHVRAEAVAGVHALSPALTTTFLPARAKNLASLLSDTLWFAIGFHFAFDFAALALFGAPNTGNGGRPIEGHLVEGRFSGPDWLTGGVRGVEASAWIFPMLIALFALFHFRNRVVRFPAPPPA